MKKTFFFLVAILLSCTLANSQRISKIDVIDSRTKLPILIIAQTAASNPVGSTNPGVWQMVFPENTDLSQVELNFSGVTLTDKYSSPTSLTEETIVEVKDSFDKTALYKIVPFILKSSDNLDFASDFADWTPETIGWSHVGTSLNSGNIRFGMLKSSAVFGINYSPAKLNLEVCYISSILDLTKGLFNIEESADGATWLLVHSFNDDTTPLKSNTAEKELYSFDLRPDSRYFKATMITKPTNGQSTANTDIRTINISKAVADGIAQNEMDIISLYPIPSNDNVKISGLKKAKKVIIYNHIGQVVKNESLMDNIFFIGGLPAGFYEARIIFDDNKEIKKTIVKD